MTGSISPSLPTGGEDLAISDSKIRGSLITLRDGLNELLDSENKIPSGSLAAEAVTAAKLFAGIRNYGVVEALPTSPTPAKGDVCRYKAAASVYWDLVYTNENATYPWNFIGGPPLASEVEAAIEVGVTAYTAGSGPTLALPLKGDYDIVLGACAYVKAASTWCYSYDIGGTAAVDADAIIGTRATAFDELQSFRNKRKTALTAVTLTTKIRNTASALVIGKRYISAIPLRVG